MARRRSLRLADRFAKGLRSAIAEGDVVAPRNTKMVINVGDGSSDGYADATAMQQATITQRSSSRRQRTP